MSNTVFSSTTVNEGRAHNARPSKRGLFFYALIQSFSTTFYLYGQPFYANRRYHWSSAQIAICQALIGLCIAIGAAVGGKVAHRFRPRLAITIGSLGGIVGISVGLFGASRGPQFLLASMVVVSLFQSMVWPAFEAMLMCNEPTARVQNLVGYFNLDWAFGTATAVLVAGSLIKFVGLNVFFWLPLISIALNLMYLRWVLPDFDRIAERAGKPDARDAQTVVDIRARGLTPSQRGAFRRLGWIANPFAYIAVNMIVTVNPMVQQRFGLDFASASAWCSVWYYVRMVSFELLRRWTDWHYRWRLLCGCFGLMIVSFAGMMLSPTLALFVLAQVAFGLCVGLTYQSSLFYSMAESEAQGEHGGSHEALIGVGQMIGPVLIVGCGRFAMLSPAVPIWLVLGLLAFGLMALVSTGRQTGR